MIGADGHVVRAASPGADESGELSQSKVLMRS